MPSPSRNCTCGKYADLEPNRKSITRRIKDSKQLRNHLSVVGEGADKQNKLYRCAACGQYWQGSYAWNWGGQEYLFKVPEPTLPEWEAQPYVQPDQLLIYHSLIDEFHERIQPQESGSICNIPQCGKQAIRLSKYCLLHHIEQLQATGMLPKQPQGKYFPPYDGS